MRLSSTLFRRLGTLLVPVSLIGLATCTPPPTVEASDTLSYRRIEFGEQPAYLTGDDIVVTAIVRDKDEVAVRGVDVTWTISDPTVAQIVGPSVITTVRPVTALGDAEVSSDLKLKALSQGTFVVTATVVGARDTHDQPLAPVSQSISITAPTGFSVTPAPLVFPVGSEVNLGAVVVGAHGEPLPVVGVKWNCLQGSAVATIFDIFGVPGCTTTNGYMNIIGVAVGTTTFHLTVPDALISRYPFTFDLPVTVTPQVATVTVLPVPFQVGGSVHFTANLKDAQGNVLPAGLLDESGKIAVDHLAWSSSDATVASVNSTTGVITGVAADAVTISAKYCYLQPHTVSGLVCTSGSAQVSVIPSTFVISFDPAAISVTVGQSMPLDQVSVRNQAGALQPLPLMTWVSRNSSLATVTQPVGNVLGTVTGVSTGPPTTTPFTEVDILGRALGAQGVLPVTVYREVATMTIAPITLAPGEQVTLAPVLKDNLGNVIPNSATIFTFDALDPAIAAYVPYGFAVAVAANPTPARIRITSQSGASVIASISVVIPNTNPIATVRVTPNSASMAVGTQASKFTAKFFDAAGTPTAGTPVWITDVSAVASINQSGLITANGPGVTGVLAVDNSGGIFARALLRVAGASGVAGLAVLPLSANVSTTTTFAATAFDINGVAMNPGAVTWTSSDPNVASVNINTGVVTAQNPGGTIIKATRDGQIATGAVTVGIGGSIKGTLSSATNQYLAAAEVTWSPNSSNLTKIVVDAGTNAFVIPGLSPGVYTVTVGVAGFPTLQVFTAVVTLGQTTVLPVAPFP